MLLYVLFPNVPQIASRPELGMYNSALNGSYKHYLFTQDYWGNYGV